jgi:hypothetical protein
MCAPHRSYTEIGLITRLIDHIPVLAVIVAFLPRLCYLQVISNDSHCFFSLFDYIRAKDFPFTGFRLVERCSVSATIESFKRCHAQTGLITVVVGELSKWKAFFPFHACHIPKIWNVKIK